MSHQYPESQKCQTLPREPKAPDNTRRAKSARQIIPGDNTQRAKSDRQYPESQKRQTIPREPKVTDNTLITNYFFSQNCFENKKVASITQFT